MAVSVCGNKSERACSFFVLSIMSLFLSCETTQKCVTCFASHYTVLHNLRMLLLPLFDTSQASRSDGENWNHKETRVAFFYAEVVQGGSCIVLMGWLPLYFRSEREVRSDYSIGIVTKEEAGEQSSNNIETRELKVHTCKDPPWLGRSVICCKQSKGRH